MGTGLVIGKFMPLHRGHMGLIDFAVDRCSRLIILLAARDHEPVPLDLRLQWLRETYGDDDRVQIEYTVEPLPDSADSSREVSMVWARYLSRRFPGVSTVFSSEKYGEYLAEYIGISHRAYDPERSESPISGTMVREEPFVYWDYIPEAVRPYYRRKVCIYGPESTGKSTLTEKLASFYNTSYVPEMARELLGEKHVVYEDIPAIAELHAREILKQEKTSDRILLCDTDLITTRIYSKLYFNQVPDFPRWIETANRFHLYLFLDTDTTWVEDPQRDLGHRRDELRERFMDELEGMNVPFVLVSGCWSQRFMQARDAIESRWKFPPHVLEEN